jgi:hypothetical protein
MLLLIIYAFLDSNNKFYANIAALFIASIIGLYLAAVISIGLVQYDPGNPRIELGNATTWYCIDSGGNITPTDDPADCEILQMKSFAINVSVPQCYYCDPPEVEDSSYGLIMLLFAVFTMIYSALMAYDAYLEYKTNKTARDDAT